MELLKHSMMRVLFMKKTYQNNILNGAWKQYFLNGKIKLEGIYKEGKRHGRQSYFFPNGEIYSSGIYQNDMKIGEWIYNNEEGITDTIINYNE